MSMKDKALALCRQGFAVFPLQANSKRPLPGSSGYKDATLEEWEVEAAWDEHPNANIGIAPALCDPPLMVVDVEGPAKGADPNAIIKELGFPRTLTAKTISAGAHLYYGTGDAHVVSSAGKLGQYVDIRAAGGYVVAPGSVIDGIEYRWLADSWTPIDADSCLEAPDWLIQAAGRAEERSPEADKCLVEWDLPANLKIAKEYLESERCPPAIEGQGGHDQTYRTAALVRDWGVSADGCEALMASAYNPRCVPEWDEEELLSIVEHAYKYAKRPAGTKAAAGSEGLSEMQRLAQTIPENLEFDEYGNRHGSGLSDAKPELTKDWLLSWEQMSDLPIPQWVVDKTILEHGVVLVYGPWGSMKTFVALDLALSIATGRVWADSHPVEPGDAIYVTGEGRHGIRQRCLAWAEAHLEGAGIPTFWFCSRMPNLRDADELQSWMLSLKKRAPRVLVIDTVSHAMAGLDENSTKDASDFMATIYGIRDVLGCVIILVHHTGKDKQAGARGSAEFSQKADTIISMESPQDKMTVLTMTKQKDAAPWNSPIGFCARPVGESLVLSRSDAPMSAKRGDDKRAETILWASKAVGLLAQFPTQNFSAGVGPSSLAREIARHTVEGDGWEVMTKPISQWLSRTAGNSTLADHVAGRTDKGFAAYRYNASTGD